MARIKVRVKAGDQKPGTRRNSRRCSIATAVKREYGVSAVVKGTTAVIRGQRYQLAQDGRDVVADHDAGNRVGSRTVTLVGKPLPASAGQAGAARGARRGPGGRRPGPPGRRRPPLSGPRPRRRYARRTPSGPGPGPTSAPAATTKPGPRGSGPAGRRLRPGSGSAPAVPAPGPQPGRKPGTRARRAPRPGSSPGPEGAARRPAAQENHRGTPASPHPAARPAPGAAPRHRTAPPPLGAAEPVRDPPGTQKSSRQP